MAKITIEYDEGSNPKVDQSPVSAPSGSISDSDGGSAPGESSPSDAPAFGLFERFREDAVNAGGPPEWLVTALSVSPSVPNAAPDSGEEATDGGAAPEE